MSSEKPKGNENPRDKENPKERMERKCTSCGGTGKVKPPSAVREATCQKCKGKGFTIGQ